LATADVTVRGAGIFGLSIACVCASRGARVRVVDPFGVGAGSSGGIVGALAPHTPEKWNAKKEFQFQSLMMAEEFWQGIDDLSGLSSGYGRSGRLQPIAGEQALVLARERADSAKKLWQGRAEWEVVAANTFGTWAPASPSGWIIHDTLSGRMHPRGACASLAAAVVALGGEIVTEASDEGAVVWATGYRGMLDLSAELGRTVGNGVKGQAVLLRHDARQLPQLFADALHIIPHADGTVAVGSTSEREFDAPDTVDRQLDDVLARAVAAFPVLAGAQVLERWAGVRPRAKSRAPMLGGYPGREGQYIANGGFKIGFGMAPKIAHVMADLVLEGRDAIPDDFRVEASL
jgi:glycine/D-amino acid oxidase-like deaminating enzyme